MAVGPPFDVAGLELSFKAVLVCGPLPTTECLPLFKSEGRVPGIPIGNLKPVSRNFDYKAESFTSP